MAPTPVPGQQAAQLYQQGMMLLSQGRPEQAIGVLSRVAGMKIDARNKALVNRALGMALQMVGRNAEAVGPLELAERALSGDAELSAKLAQAYRSQGRFEDALRACRRCMRAAPSKVGVVGFEIELLVRLKRDEEARERLADVDAQGIVDPDIDVARSLLAMRGGDLVEAEACLRRHLATATTRAVRALVGFSLGDVLDAMGRYDDAWRAYADANETLGEQFRPDLFDRDVDRIIAAWTPEQIARLRAGGSPDERAVLVVGMPRSGTTLMESILAAHPQVYAGGEMKTLGECVGLIGRAIQASPDTTPERVTPELIGQAAGHYARQMDRVGAGATRVTNKLPMNVVVLGLFAAMFPRGRIVHCRRDPRDVCLSCYCRMFRESMPFTTRLDWLAGYYRAYRRLMDHWVSAFARLDDPPTVHEVRYETLVREPEGTVRGVLDSLGLGWEAACLRVGEGRASVTLRTDQIGRGLYSTSVGRYRAYEAHLGPVTGALADLIETYERTGGGSA